MSMGGDSRDAHAIIFEGALLGIRRQHCFGVSRKQLRAVPEGFGGGQGANLFGPSPSCDGIDGVGKLEE